MGRDIKNREEALMLRQMCVAVEEAVVIFLVADRQSKQDGIILRGNWFQVLLSYILSDIAGCFQFKPI